MSDYSEISYDDLFNGRLLDTGIDGEIYYPVTYDNLTDDTVSDDNLTDDKDQNDLLNHELIRSQYQSFSTYLAGLEINPTLHTIVALENMIENVQTCVPKLPFFLTLQQKITVPDIYAAQKSRIELIKSLSAQDILILDLLRLQNHVSKTLRFNNHKKIAKT